MNDALGDRMKDIEGRESDRRFLPLLPVCARLDGRSFSKFTKGLERPFDTDFHNIMVATTKYLVEETNANMGYTQSDEISLVWYSDDYTSQIFFDGRIQKMNSILASMCSVRFNCLLMHFADDLSDLAAGGRGREDIAAKWQEKVEMMPVFDSRVWQVPTPMEAVNTFMWREWDATKNAISQAASHYYSHKELDGKNGSQKQELLHRKGINFNNYPVWFKRGTYIQRKKVFRQFTTEEIDELPKKHKARSNPDLMVERTEVDILDMPIFSKVINRTNVLFRGDAPMCELVGSA